MNRRIFKIWLISTIVFMLMLNVSIFFWDFYSGADTLGFGVLEPFRGMGMFYVYMISFFSSLIVLNAVVKTNYFGMGLLIWLPYAVIGLFVEAYYEMILNDALISYWSVIGWCIFGLLNGFSADLSFMLLSKRTKLSKKNVAGLSGVVMSLVYFFTSVIALGFFYKVGWGAGSFNNPGSFLGVAYFALPWMLINAYFGGFVGYTINYLKEEK